LFIINSTAGTDCTVDLTRRCHWLIACHCAENSLSVPKIWPFSRQCHCWKRNSLPTNSPKFSLFSKCDLMEEYSGETTMFPCWLMFEKVG
jgi:hypothetical protein